jgi:NDP-sugar pyrophosphorylase family protein
METGKIDVIILCGGAGKRLKAAVDDYPKSMAKINDKPFLDILIDYVASFGFKRFILCIGYRGNVIEEYFEKNKKGTLEILFSREKEPLGTGGAIKNAESLIKSSPFLVMNGDSFCELDLPKFIRFHKEKRSLASITLSEVSDENNDYGAVILGDSDKIIGFQEKKDLKYPQKLVNAGVYLFQIDIFSKMPSTINFSLEYDFFPKMVNEEFYGYKIKAAFIDIGTPQRYKKANQILASKGRP